MQVRAMRAAIVFLSRIPVGGFPYSEREQSWAPAYFPFVGLLVGIGATPGLLLAEELGSTLAAGLTLLISVWLTGAFHEDGLADTADALGGTHGHERLHDILKDSRIGTYGSVALFFSLALRLFALDALIRNAGVAFGTALSTPLLFVLVQVLARTGPVGLMASLPYVAGEAAKGASVARGGRWPQFAVSSLWGLTGLVAAATLGMPIPVVLGLTAVLVATTLVLRSWFERRAGGFTGDFLGATEQVLELVLMLSLSWWLTAGHGLP